MQSLFACPVCRGKLEIDGKTYRCRNGHCFDMAKEGYVNLLMSGKSTSLSGDDRQMVSSRTRFLDGGYYEPLRSKVCDIIKNSGIENPSLLDSGCGEGYYTSAYSLICKNTLGVDISKNAAKQAAKRCKNAEIAVGSVYHLPIADSSIDIIVNCFSPNAPDEFSRVLKKDGYLIYVVPAPRHLWELKCVLYENPYENEEKVESYDGFELVSIENVKASFNLTTNEDIESLFHMTPYTWTTPKDGAERLSRINELSVSAEFNIHVFRAVKD